MDISDDIIINELLRRNYDVNNLQMLNTSSSSITSGVQRASNFSSTNKLKFNKNKKLCDELLNSLLNLGHSKFKSNNLSNNLLLKSLLVESTQYVIIPQVINNLCLFYDYHNIMLEFHLSLESNKINDDDNFNIFYEFTSK